MADNPDQTKVIDLLFQQGLLTQDQVRRVYLALHDGRDLGWALSHVPLVEHLNFLKAQSVVESGVPSRLGMLTPVPVRSSRGATPTPTTAWPSSLGTPTPKPSHPISELYEVKPITRAVKGASNELGAAPLEGIPTPMTENQEADYVPTLDLDNDMDYSVGFEGVVKPMAGSPLPEDTPAAAFTPPPHGPMHTPRPVRTESPDAFLRPGVTPPSYDLADDEGIPLVNRVNGLLVDSLENGVRELIIHHGSGGLSITSVTELGTEGQARSLPPDEGVKICNRLKIMARIEPWRKPPQRGVFIVTQAKRQSRILIEVTESPEHPGQESLRLHLLSAP